MFSLINFVKTVLLNEAPTTSCTVLQPIPFANGEAKSTASAIVTQAIVPGQTGQIKFQGSWWTARCLQGITLIPGVLVHVIGRQTITLYVEPMFSNPVQGD